MKTNKKKIKKPYEEAMDIFNKHHLFSCLSGALLFREMKIPSVVTLSNNSLGYLNVSSDSRAVFYFNSQIKLKKEEWFFIFSLVGIILSFDLYKKLKNNDQDTHSNLLKERAIIIFAINYIYEVFDIKDIPEVWLSYFSIKEKYSLKSEDSIYENLKNDDVLLNLTVNLNFLGNSNTSIFFKKETSYYYGWANLTFSEVFSKRLISTAKETIALRSDIVLTEDDERKERLLSHQAKRWFINHYPLLSALAAQFDIVEDIKICQNLDIQIAAVSAINKIIYINPSANLSLEGMKFVIAHEILHIALNHSSRLQGRDPLIWNLACDFVINHWLVSMSVGIPPEGIFLDSSLANLSADEIYLMIINNEKLRKRMGTLKSLKAGDGKIIEKKCDMIDYDYKYFSDFEDACKEHLLRGLYLHEYMGRGLIPASLEEDIKAINQPAIPWQVELAKWIAEQFPLEESVKTYAKASRRQSSTPNIPRPRYIRPTESKSSYTLGVILDTSGSMDKELLGKALGAIASYCATQEVKYVRLIFCDAAPYDEGFVPVEILSQKIKVKGRGGTVIQQAVNYLENINDFPKEAPILIISDGFFEPTLTVKRKHALLVPRKALLPFTPRGEVFEFK